MGNGKQSAAGQAARRQQIIDYIKEHGPVKSGKICADLSLSRSSLSDDINAINAQHPVIESPKRGYYEYHAEQVEVRGRIDRTYVRRWYELALLSDCPCTAEELLDLLADAGMECSLNTLYADIRALKKDHYIKSAEEIGTYCSTALYTPGADEIRHYRQARTQTRTSPRVLISTYDTIDRKLTRCIPGTDLTEKKSVSTRRAGKQNRLSKEQLALLGQFQQFPYPEFSLRIPYRTNRGADVTATFSVGMIVYSVEANRIYLLGKNSEKRNTIIALDRIRMDGVAILETPNYCYQSAEFHRIFEEMFHLSADEPVEVRVRFQNLPFIRNKVQRLCEVRKQAKTERIREDSEILYTDTLRGIGDFARYLRRFGRSAIVDAPEELKEMMLFTSRRVIGLYEKDEPEKPSEEPS